MERRDRTKLADRREDGLVDDGGLDEIWAAVDNPVTDGLDLRRGSSVQRLDCLHALVVEDEVELEARRAGVDDEDRPHGLERPDPVADLRIVFAVLARVRAGV